MFGSLLGPSQGEHGHDGGNQEQADFVYTAEVGENTHGAVRVELQRWEPAGIKPANAGSAPRLPSVM